MSCRRVRDRASDHLEARIPPGGRERFERHLARCASCARFVEEIRQTVHRLDTLPREPMPPAMKARLLQALHPRRTP
jgi:anti-sigma factor RsiW